MGIVEDIMAVIAEASVDSVAGLALAVFTVAWEWAGSMLVEAVGSAPARADMVEAVVGMEAGADIVKRQPFGISLREKV